MKTFFTVVLLVTLPGILSPTYGQWPKHTIDPDLPNATVLHFGDIDGDTDLDVVASAWSVNKVFWYENSGDNLTWTKHVIDENLNDVIGVYLAYIDDDNDLDVVAAGWAADDVVWYENILPDTTWPKRTIDGNLDGADWINVADIDGDNDNDVAATGGLAGDVVWYENNGGTTITWQKWWIDGDLGGALQIRIADIDGDDTLDVVAAGDGADDVVWYENMGGMPITWKKWTIDGNLDGAISMSVGDIDGDNDRDVAAVGYGANDVVWYENILPDTTWPKHLIDENLPEPRHVDVADIDGDALLDVLATSYSADDVVWYENILPDTTWPKRTIDGNLDGARVFYAVDIDDDTDLDVIALGQYANDAVWYRNIPTGIERFSGRVANGYVLSQNYPNPFNPSTTIEFDLPMSSVVILKVFNILGEEITTLVSDRLSAGSYSYEWDASNLASGVYIYRLKAGEYLETRKMVLIR